METTTDRTETHSAGGNAEASTSSALRRKPCPFCGNTDLSPCGGERTLYWMCGECFTYGPTEIGGDNKPTRHDWNTRPIEDALAEALQSASESLSLLFDDAGGGRPLLPVDWVARGVVEGAFYGVREKIESALALHRGENED